VSLTFDARWGEWSKSRPVRFITRNDPLCPVYRRLAGPQDRSGRLWRRENFLPPPRFEPRTFQPAASRYPGPLNKNIYNVCHVMKGQARLEITSTRKALQVRKPLQRRAIQRKCN
jgi:hypothetical protein